MGIEPKPTPMNITPTTTVDDVINHITSLSGKIPAAATAELRQCIEDGLAPDFIDDAGIDTMAQHLDDVADRLEGLLDANRDWVSTPEGKATRRSLNAAIKAVSKARGL